MTIQQDKFLSGATKPRRTCRATDSHNHVEVVAAFKWRVDLRLAARGAHSIRVGPTGTSNLCDYGRLADRTPIETPPVILIRPVNRHRKIMTEMVVQCNKYLCDAANGICAMQQMEALDAARAIRASLSCRDFSETFKNQTLS